MKCKKVISGLLLGIGLVTGIGLVLHKVIIQGNKAKKGDLYIISPKRFEIGFQLMSKWLRLKNEGISLKEYFTDNEILTVAIYGMGELGERLYEELCNNKINVSYAIDRIAEKKSIYGLKIVKPDEFLEEVDAIIVTPVQDYTSIEETLEKKTTAQIVSLEDVIYYCI